MKLQFNTYYFIGFIVLLALEAVIAIFLKDGFIRHTLGDYLVVILLYCFFRSFISGNSVLIALGVLFISYGIEFLQLTHLLTVLHLQDHNIARIVLGSTFSIGDLVAYTFGFFTILIFEHISHGNS